MVTLKSFKRGQFVRVSSNVNSAYPVPNSIGIVWSDIEVCGKETSYVLVLCKLRDGRADYLALDSRYLFSAGTAKPAKQVTARYKRTCKVVERLFAEDEELKTKSSKQ